jgi:hypothetical protein
VPTTCLFFPLRPLDMICSLRTPTPLEGLRALQLWYRLNSSHVQHILNWSSQLYTDSTRAECPLLPICLISADCAKPALGCPAQAGHWGSRHHFHFKEACLSMSWFPFPAAGLRRFHNYRHIQTYFPPITTENNVLQGSVFFLSWINPIRTLFCRGMVTNLPRYSATIMNQRCLRQRWFSFKFKFDTYKYFGCVR